MRLIAVLGVAKQLQIDAAKQLASLDVVRVTLDDTLRFGHRFADPVCVEVEIGEPSLEVAIVRVSGERELVLLDRFIHELRALIQRDVLLVHVR